MDVPYQEWFNITASDNISYNTDIVSSAQDCCNWIFNGVNAQSIASGWSERDAFSSIPSAGSLVCSAFWANGSGNDNPTAVTTWTVGQFDTAQVVNFDGTTATTGTTYCNRNNPADNRSNMLDYYFTSFDQNNVSICLGQNVDCSQWTFSNNPCSSSQAADQFITIPGFETTPNGGMTTIRATPQDKVCIAAWSGSPDPNQPPDGCTTANISQGETGTSYSWAVPGTPGQFQLSAKYTNCTGGGGNGGRQCNNNGDCTNGLICNMQTHRCGPCSNDNQCGSGQVCTNGTCEPDGNNNNGGGGDNFLEKYWWVILILVVVLILIIWAIIHFSRKSAKKSELTSSKLN